MNQRLKQCASRAHLLGLWACVGGLVVGCGGSGGDSAVTPSPPPDSSTPTPPPAPEPPPPPPPPASGDTTPPTVVLTGPADFTDDLTGTVTLTATATDDTAVSQVEFQVDGAAVGAADAAAPYAATVDTAAYASGQHVLRARARDAAGNVSDWGTATVRFGGTVRVPAGFTQTDLWVTGLTAATALAEAPDGRLFVAEQGGRVRIVKNGALLPTPFATVAVENASERGLVGITLQPDFATNGFVYVYYTSTSGGTHNRVSRFVATGDVAGVEDVLVDLPTLGSAKNHNGGALHFGADGTLYVAVGDNAVGTNAPLLSSVFGKLLRFNADGSIPADNPHFDAGNPTALTNAVWARGLRNPFSFAVQPGTGALYINDVGEDTWEEVNLGAAGANYGWPSTEGPTHATGITAPLFTYRHTPTTPPGTGPGGFFTGSSIVGATFYPSGGAFPASYHGNYFFADYIDKVVGRLDVANGHAAYAFATTLKVPVDVLAGRDGALYVLNRDSIARIARTASP